jgi:hypothetical protein
VTAQDELTRLGKLTPDEIARDLKKRHCEGVFGSTTCCPVAKRLEQIVGRPVSVAISIAFVDRIPLLMPANVCHFVHAWDARQYPDLIAR